MTSILLRIEPTVGMFYSLIFLFLHHEEPTPNAIEPY